MNIALCAEGAALLFLLWRLILQKSYLVCAVADKTVRWWLFGAAALLLVRLCFTPDQSTRLFCLFGAGLCLLACLLRGGITPRGFAGLRGLNCPWIKVRKVTLSKDGEQILLHCSHITGEFTLRFKEQERDALVKALDIYCRKQEAEGTV